MSFGAIIFLLAMSLSNSSANGLCIYKPSGHDLRASQVPASRLVPSDISFTEKSAADGITENGCRFSALLWEANDGVTVTIKIINCKSSAMAETTLNELTRDATKIFERKMLKSGNGKNTGLRIIAAFSGREPLQRPEVILLRRGSDVYRIESSSFAHALVFEKKWPNV